MNKQSGKGVTSDGELADRNACSTVPHRITHANMSSLAPLRQGSGRRHSCLM